MAGVPGASKRIEERVLAWPGVEAHPHRFGGVEYRLGNREVGHIHGDHMLDIAFPKQVREELVSAGLARPHHLLPQSGWVSFYLREEGDIEQAVSLLARSYELAREQQARRNGPVSGTAS
jgi:predicted DNA-binding protein (MmcQ/YjbR family)